LTPMMTMTTTRFSQIRKKAKMANKKKLTKKARIALEARFIGRVIWDTNIRDVREDVAGYGINWRQFCDRRHQTVWRALETLNLRDKFERMEIIEKEAYAAAEAEVKEKGLIRENYPDDLVRGEPGSAAAKAFRKKLIEESRGIIWLELALEEAGALHLVGGKTYLRELAENGDNELLFPEDLRKLLFGME
jgi:hypothetical protein